VEEQDVEDDLLAPPRLARQVVEGAQVEAEREDGDGRVHEQEGLLVQAELLDAQAAHEQQRQREGEGERQALGRQHPRRAHGQRAAPALVVLVSQSAVPPPTPPGV
jgi:hypothetical protein